MVIWGHFLDLHSWVPSDGSRFSDRMSWFGSSTEMTSIGVELVCCKHHPGGVCGAAHSLDVRRHSWLLMMWLADQVEGCRNGPSKEGASFCFVGFWKRTIHRSRDALHAKDVVLVCNA